MRDVWFTEPNLLPTYIRRLGTFFVLAWCSQAQRKAHKDAHCCRRREAVYVSRDTRNPLPTPFLHPIDLYAHQSGIPRSKIMLLLKHRMMLFTFSR